MDVGACSSATVLGIGGECFLEFFEQIGVFAEVTIVIVSLGGRFLHLFPHLEAVPPMEGVPLDIDLLIFSRRKICSKVRLTDVVPAPEEPVITMMGCSIDILPGSKVRSSPAQEAASGK